MKSKKIILRIINGMITCIVSLFLLIVGTYSVYAIWDNNQIYLEVDDVMNEVLQIKPDRSNPEPGFEELSALNDDICAWLTLDGTKIDYPVLQGEDNLTYINRNVYGDFALSGSIFLDARCDHTFQGMYSLLYGHHMAERKMFGDLEKYEDQDFFSQNTTGTLLLKDRSYDLKIFACIRVAASDSMIFSPGVWQSNVDGLVDYVSVNALHKNESLIQENQGKQVLAMSTCSSAYTDARTVVLAYME